MKLDITVLITIGAALLSVSTFTDAEIYKWFDEQGNAHFSDAPPADLKSEEVELRINTFPAVEIKPLVQRLGQGDKVVMYSASWCGVCKKAKRYFKKNNIPYKVYDVEKSRIGKRDFKRLGGKSVPIIIVGTKRMNGFTASRFSKLYEKEIVQKRKAENLEVSTQ
jgi:glutaredoxin